MGVVVGVGFLSDLFQNTSLSVDIEALAPMGNGFALCAWVGGTPAAVDAWRAVRADQGAIDAVKILTSTELPNDDGQRHLMYLEPAQDAATGLQTICEAQGTIIEGDGTNGWMNLTLWFEAKCDVTDFYLQLDDSPADFIIEGPETDPEDSLTDIMLGLTPKQREAIYQAYKLGYFDIPRSQTLEELSTDLGISDQAASELVRRALRKLLARIIGDEDVQMS